MFPPEDNEILVGGVMLQFTALQLVYTSGFPLYFYAITYLVGITSPLWYGLLVEERSG